MKTIKALCGFAILVFAFATVVSAQSAYSQLGGGSLDLRSEKGKVVVLAVGATWLPLSVKQAEYANALAKRYSGRGVVVYFVATDSTLAKSKNYATDDDIKRFAGTSKLAVPIVRDSDGAISLKRFGIDQLPSFVVLDKQGNQAAGAFGGIDPKFDITISISKTIDSLL